MGKRAMRHLDVFRTASSPARRRRWERGSRLMVAQTLCAAALSAFGLNPAAAAEAKPGAAPAKAAPAATRVSVDPAAACPEISAQQLSQSTLKPGAVLDRLRAGSDGARARLRELPVREISRTALADMVLGQNLGVQSAAESVAIAQSLVVQRDAVFDPTFFSSLSYTNKFRNPRRDLVTRMRDQDPTTLLQEDNQLLQDQQQNTQLQCLPSLSIDGVQAPANAGCQVPPGISMQQEYASYNSNSDHRAVGSLGVSWNFIIGGAVNDETAPGLSGGEPTPPPITPFAVNGTVSASLSSTWHKPVAPGNGAPTNTTPDYPSGLTFDPYGWNDKLFWTSSANVSLTLPLPYTKNFGYDGSPDYYNYQVARSGQRQSSWSYRSTRNSTLEQALLSYWDLAQAVQTLRTLIELENVLTERKASQQRLFDTGLATRYDLAQLEAQLASLQTQEETTWNSLLSASSHLGTLVSSDQRTLLLPADAEALLRQPVSINQAEAYDRALRTHPDIKAAEESHTASQLTLTYSEHQDLPDVSFSASYGVGQNDAVFGYVNLPQSLAHLAKPDTSNFFIGIQYHVPIGMNATEAAVERARISERQAYDQTRQARQTIVNTVDQALGTARSAQLVVSRSEDDVKLAQCAFDRARDQRELGLAAEFEVLNKYQDLVSARLGLVTAKVNLRKAAIHLLAAQGTLEQDYVR